MGIYLTSSEIKLHEWRITLRKAQATLKQARNKRRRDPVEMEGAEAGVKWALRRVAAAQTTVEMERVKRAMMVESLLSVAQQAEA